MQRQEAAPPRAASPAAAIYRERVERFGTDLDIATRRWNTIANLRLVAFVAAAGMALWALMGRSSVLGAGALVLLAVFVGLMVYHGRLNERRRRAAAIWSINDEALRRLARDWEHLPLRHTLRADPDHPFAADLDLFGRAALFHLLEQGGSGVGDATLARWLLAPASAETVRARQEAVRELVPRLDFRDELGLRGRLMGEGRPDPAPFVHWAESAPWLRQFAPLVWCARVSTALLWGLVAAQVTGVTPYPLWAIFLVPNLILLSIIGRESYRILARAWLHGGAFRVYAGLFELITHTEFRTPLLRRLQASLTVEGLAAHQQMRRLGRLASLSIPRSSQLYILIQLFTLWDIHALWLLERWQDSVGRHARGWLETLGEVEALAALATLAHDNPDWAFPEVDESADRLEAEALGHPIIPDSVRVTNDVTVGPSGTFLLVTGSNMSGKSTLLRALGVNLVLAGTGGPVCAASMRCPPVTLWTAMRVQDSLARGVSYFMAELERLKAVVDAARAARAEGTRTFFYLLDEILQGTNTAERQIAARRIILHLVAQGALGAVSTHDLTLADAPDVAAAARLVHFTETITADDAPRMTFDYKLRPGLATSTNALKLMEIVGLDLDGA